MSDVPAVFHDLMVKLEPHHASSSLQLRAQLGSLFRNVRRMFDVTPPDEEARAKALQRADHCLGIARAEWANRTDQASAPLLEQVQQLLRAHAGAAAPPASPRASPSTPARAHAGAAAPPASPRASPSTPAPVWPPPRPRSAAPPVWPPPRPAAPLPSPSPSRPRLARPSPLHSSPSRSPSSRSSRPARIPRAPAVADPDSTQALVARLLGQLAALSAQRRTLLQDSQSIRSELVALARAVERVIRALAWAGAPAAACVVQALAAIATAEDPEAASDDAIFAVAMALLGTGHARDLFDCLAPDGAPSVRTSALAAEPGRPASPALLDILADQALIVADLLVPHLDSPDDRVAAHVAELLARLGRGRTDAGAPELRPTATAGSA